METPRTPQWHPPQSPPRAFDSDAFCNTMLPRAIRGADGLANELRRMHENAHLVTDPRQLDRLDMMADALNDRVRHGTAQVRQVLAAARRGVAPLTAAEAGHANGRRTS